MTSQGLDGEKNVAASWHIWFYMGAVSGMVMMADSIVVYMYGLLKEGAYEAEGCWKKFTLILPCIFSLAVLGWTIYGSVIHFSRDGKIASQIMESSSKFMTVWILIMNLLLVLAVGGSCAGAFSSGD